MGVGLQGPPPGRHEPRGRVHGLTPGHAESRDAHLQQERERAGDAPQHDHFAMRLAAATDVDVRVTVSHGAPSQLAVSQCVCRVTRGRARARRPAGLAVLLLEDLPLLRFNTIVLLNAGRARAQGT